jgi:FkbM family methyltransferase
VTAVGERVAAARAELGRITGRQGPFPRARLLAAYGSIARAWAQGHRTSAEPLWLPLMGYRVAYHDLYALRELFLEIFVDGCYDIPLGPAPMVVDGGANTGLATLYFALRWPGARILAFEPSSSAFRLLELNVEANAIAAELHPVALGRTAGTAELFLDTSRPAATMNSLRPDRLGSGATETVRVVTLSDYIDGPVDLVKLDVEGAELDVVEDLAETGALDAVANAVLEHHSHTDRRLEGLGRIRDLLTASGFQVEVSDPLPDPIVPGRRLERIVRAWREA